MLYKVLVFPIITPSHFFQWGRLCLMIAIALYSQASIANPSGAQVIGGHVSIDNSVTGVTTITNSPNAIINWKNFNITPDETTHFIQENSQSAVLNRIISNQPSGIFGQLVSNGQVFLINPNGILFSKSAVIDTQGLIASSLSLSNDSFQKGIFHFMTGATAGSVVNEGIIHTGKAGNILLIAPQIENKGILQTDGGSITLAAGQELTLVNLDNPDIHFQIQAPQDNVLNIGQLFSEGGAINMFVGMMNHTDAIQATGIAVDKQGNIQLVPTPVESISSVPMPITPQGQLSPVLSSLMQGTPEQISGVEKKIENSIGLQTNTVLTMPTMQGVLPPPPIVANTNTTSDNLPALPPPAVPHDDKLVLPSASKDDKKGKEMTFIFNAPDTKINKHSGQCK